MEREGGRQRRDVLHERSVAVVEDGDRDPAEQAYTQVCGGEGQDRILGPQAVRERAAEQVAEPQSRHEGRDDGRGREQIHAPMDRDDALPDDL